VQYPAVHESKIAARKMSLRMLRIGNAVAQSQLGCNGMVRI
jgi:hypothetical protein